MEGDLIVRYKHIRFKNNKPLGTICVIKPIDEENEHLAIGIAICNLKDNFNKAMSKTLSRKRAFKAWHSQKSWLPVEQVFALSVSTFLDSLARDPVFTELVKTVDSEVLYKCFYI